ncbi:MAG TPA: DUF2254 domain-containing protein [Jiangellaceae bacterium]|nr:DUF2254 domain-containing protein [Jiangellaceae bacterium]
MINREVIREYTSASLWVLPTFAGLLALITGTVVSQIDLGPNSPLAFQGTADDARGLLIAISGTVVTVIALVLGLTVVALQLASTQFSPRLLRNFLRDRPIQIVLSLFVATFIYSAAGLFTVGVSSGARVEGFPRLAVSGAMVLLFVSMAAVVFFADHLAHAIQIDAITGRVERGALGAISKDWPGQVEAPYVRPEWAVALTSAYSGYVQTVHLEHLLPVAAQHGVTMRLRRRIGEHVVAGTKLVWIWRPNAADQPPSPEDFRRVVEGAVRIGFERTLEQDVGFSIRQLVDVACKALSPAINDPYTAVQAIDHLSVIFSKLSPRPLGDVVLREGDGVVILPGRRFDELLATACGLIRRYGSREPTVLLALFRLLGNCTEFTGGNADRIAAIRTQAELIMAAGERDIAQPADLVALRAGFEALARHLPAQPDAAPAAPMTEAGR